MEFLKKYRVLISFIGFVFILYLAYIFRSIVAYVAISAVLSLIGRPLTEKLNRIKIGKFKMPPSISAIVTILFFNVSLLFMLSLFIPVVATEISEVSKIDVNELADRFEEPFAFAENTYRDLSLLLGSTKSLKELVSEQINKFFNATNISNIANDMVGILGNTLIAILSVTFITFFFLKEARLFKGMVNALTPVPYEDKMKIITKKSRDLLRRYFLGLLLQISTIAVLVTIGLTIVGLGDYDLDFKLALTIGLFAGLINVIPYVGPLIGGGFGLLMVTMTNLNLELYPELSILLLKVFIVFLIVQLFDNLFSQPIIFSNSVMAHPLEIFLLILMAGSFGGITAMILAIPTYTFLRIVAKEFFSEFKLVKNLTKDI